MTLRTRLLITFIALGAVPLMAVGWITSLRNLRAVEDLVARETLLVAQRVSEEIGERYDARFSELLFLAENTETLRLFGSNPLPAFALAPQGPEAFLSQVWESLASRYRWVRFEDPEGRIVLSFGEADPATVEFGGGISEAGSLVISEGILDPTEDRKLGTVSAAVNSAVIIPGNLPERGFGESGYVALVDTGANRILYHPQRMFLSQSLSQLLPNPPDGFNSMDEGEESFEYSVDEEGWIASMVPVRSTSWAVVSGSPLGDFSRPFRSAARANLLLVLTITLVAAAAFLFTTLRTTRSLMELTGAARRVAHGELDPELPPPGKDEAGTLSRTFDTMLGRIRTMIRQVEENRQMAAVGEFSAQIAHELRNPLTAIRMSLQGLHRKLGETEHARPLEIALQETERLDRVASGVMSLGRKPAGEMTLVSAGDLVRGVTDSVASEFEEMGIRTRLSLELGEAPLRVDEEALRGALINLLRNSAEAMTEGGEIVVAVQATENGILEIHITDEGPGIPPDLAGKIFDPFVTTKARGNGFGLPLALRAAEANGGKLRLLEPEGGAGAHFLLEIPMHEPGVDR